MSICRAVTPFVVRAVVPALRAFPVVNSSVEGEEIVYKKDINVGIAVALDWGLIVPVVRNADELSMAGLARRINDLADRARAKKLNPDEVQGEVAVQILRDPGPGAGHGGSSSRRCGGLPAGRAVPAGHRSRLES